MIRFSFKIQEVRRGHEKRLGWGAISLMIVLFLSCQDNKERKAIRPEKIEEGKAGLALSGKTGPELVELLKSPQTRLAAYAELHKREESNKWKGEKEFRKIHRDPELIICPNGEDSPPLFLLLSDFLNGDEEDYSDDEGFDRLFQAMPQPEKPLIWKTKKLIEAFSSEGKFVAPFGGNNVVSHGVIMDLNRDGLIERADKTSYGVDAVHNIEVLEVSVVLEKAKCILAVLYNWQNDSWGYDIVDRDGSGLYAIELGPGTIGSILPKVRLLWDKRTSRYRLTTGGKENHFKLLNPDRDIWNQLVELKKAGFNFPEEPLLESSPEKEIVRRLGVKIFRPEVKPYRPLSFVKFSPEELASFMSEGNKERQLDRHLAQRPALPGHFWQGNPKDVALALADLNRDETHKSRYLIAIDDRNGTKAPLAGNLVFSNYSDPSYNACMQIYFLRVDPKKSYLAYAASNSAGTVFHSAVENREFYDLKLAYLNTQEARHIFQVIWWLDRLRTKTVAHGSGMSFGISSADGLGSLRLQTDQDTKNIELSGSLWAGSIANRWRAKFNREVLLNMVSFLLEEAVPKHLGKRWPKDSLHYFPLSTEEDFPKPTKEEFKRLSELSLQFLEWLDPSESMISIPQVAIAIKVAADLGLKSSRRLLKNIRSEKSILMYPLSKPTLRELADRAISRITLSEDSDALLKLATSNDKDRIWATEQLRKVDSGRYISALEKRLEKESGEAALNIFDEIVRVDQRRAVTIAQSMPESRKAELAVAVFAVLQKADDINKNQHLIDILIQLIQNPKKSWNERIRTIELLVPYDRPLAYSDTRIDDALSACLHQSSRNMDNSITLGAACMALARRGRKEFFSSILDQLQNRSGLASMTVRLEEILYSLALLAQKDKTKSGPLTVFLKSQLSKTNLPVNALIWTIWDADLRQFSADLQKLATASEKDYESETADSFRSEISDLRGTVYHLARKVHAIWNEKDPVARIQLYIAFGIEEGNHFYHYEFLERKTRLEQILVTLAESLTPGQKQMIISFISWYENRLKDRQEMDSRYQQFFDFLASTFRK